MAKTLANVAMTLAASGVFGSTPGSCQAATIPDSIATVVVHVQDHGGVPEGDLADARAETARVYARIGVHLQWAGGFARAAEPDGLLHVDVIILNAAMTAANNPDAKAVGQAGHATKRAYIYYPRVLAHARATGGNPARALATVIAHELGHVLLPEYSHAPSGLMKADWEGCLPVVPDFLPSQAEAIRVTLAAR